MMKTDDFDKYQRRFKLMQYIIQIHQRSDRL